MQANLDATKFDLKTFPSTRATRVRQSGLDVRTVRRWMESTARLAATRYSQACSEVTVEPLRKVTSKLHKDLLCHVLRGLRTHP